MDVQYIEWEAAHWRGINPLEWDRMPIRMKAQAIVHWQEHSLRESEANHAGKKKAEREERERPKR